MNSNDKRQVLTVSQLNRKAKQLLETHLPLIWLEGEISNFARPSSGHWYLTLKDQGAQIRGAMFRNRNQMLRFNPQNGDKVLLRARVSLYEGRGDYQLIIEHMQAAGAGDLQAQFEALKNKLFAQGLMDPARKQSLPDSIKRVAVLTSPTGAAIADVLSVFARRSPSTQVSVVPCLVQGDTAATQLSQAIEMVNRHQAADVILLTRGGGSLEDLWAFNDEYLAHCIANSQIPVVSAVGHEVDVSIADFVADLRAATPSAAAELLSQDINTLREQLLGNAVLLGQACARHIQQQKRQLQQLQRRLRHPGNTLEQQSQRLDTLEMRLNNAWQRSQKQRVFKRETLGMRLMQQHPKHGIAEQQAHLLRQQKNIQRLINERLSQAQQATVLQAEKLNALSPLAVLQRGFSLSKNAAGDIIREATQCSKGERLSIELAKGRLDCTVDTVHAAKP